MLTSHGKGKFDSVLLEIETNFVHPFLNLHIEQTNFRHFCTFDVQGIRSMRYTEIFPNTACVFASWECQCGFLVHTFIADELKSIEIWYQTREHQTLSLTHFNQSVIDQSPIANAIIDYHCRHKIRPRRLIYKFQSIITTIFIWIGMEKSQLVCAWVVSEKNTILFTIGINRFR